MSPDLMDLVFVVVMAIAVLIVIGAVAALVFGGAAVLLAAGGGIAVASRTLRAWKMQQRLSPVSTPSSSPPTQRAQPATLPPSPNVAPECLASLAWLAAQRHTQGPLSE